MDFMAWIFRMIIFGIFVGIFIGIFVHLGHIKNSIQSIERLLKFKMLSEEDKKFFPARANEGFFSRKKCPKCKQVIWSGSTACRFCGVDM